MTRVVLLGDSIRKIGYGPRVPMMLGDGYEVYQPDDNCRFAKYTLRGVLHDWKGNIEGCDIVHWNNGLWDICDLGDGVFTDPEEYVTNMLRIAAALQKMAKKVIFATTTPVIDGHPFNKNETIEAYNRLIIPKLQEMGIVINDLHGLVMPQVSTYIREDDQIHLTEAGIEACSEQTAEAIRRAAAELGLA